MRTALDEIKSYDMIFFTPNDENEGLTVVTAAHYKESGEKLKPGVAGDTFDIILFRLDEEYDITDLDKFDGVLIDAKIYVNRMIKENWYGMVARKTTTSQHIVDDVFANWSEG